ncbi:MAG TPA: HGGxSTG domain-containing protein [Aestuariivirgaceae bacterium]|nr:HGGxSTG domain-containing protein [Aestuariivirgaceae bacterium]
MSEWINARVAKRDSEAGARRRNGTLCRSPAMPNGRCRMHGGTSPGAPVANSSASKHGRHTAEANAERQSIATLIRTMKSLAGKVERLD